VPTRSRTESLRLRRAAASRLRCAYFNGATLVREAAREGGTHQIGSTTAPVQRACRARSQRSGRGGRASRVALNAAERATAMHADMDPWTKGPGCGCLWRILRPSRLPLPLLRRRRGGGTSAARRRRLAKPGSAGKSRPALAPAPSPSGEARVSGATAASGPSKQPRAASAGAN
jgi:hypothetical protein